jgi:hypothetical protein
MSYNVTSHLVKFYLVSNPKVRYILWYVTHFGIEKQKYRSTRQDEAPRNTQATLAGHTEGTKPKPRVETMVAKGEERHATRETTKTKTGPRRNQSDKGKKGGKKFGEMS